MKWLAPLRDGDDPEAEYRLLMERRRVLLAELADLELIMEGVLARLPDRQEPEQEVLAL